MKRSENRIGNLFKNKSVTSTATTADQVQVVSTYIKILLLYQKMY